MRRLSVIAYVVCVALTTVALAPAVAETLKPVIQKASISSTFDKAQAYTLDDYTVVIPAVFSSPLHKTKPAPSNGGDISSFQSTYSSNVFYSTRGPRRLTNDNEIQAGLQQSKKSHAGQPNTQILSEKSGKIQGYSTLELELKDVNATKPFYSRVLAVAVPPGKLYQFTFYTHDETIFRSAWVNRYFESIRFNP